jgi:hypothetical protein
MKKLLLVVSFAGLWMLYGSILGAQTTPPSESTTHVISDQDLSLLRRDVRANRRQLITTNLKLSDSEAAKFWPVYDQYIKELGSINDKKFRLFQDYADNSGNYSDQDSLLFIRQWLDMDIATVQLRQKYVPMVATALDGRKAATFFQLDRRIAMMLEVQVSSQMPLLQDEEPCSSSLGHCGSADQTPGR